MNRSLKEDSVVSAPREKRQRLSDEIRLINLLVIDDEPVITRLIRASVPERVNVTGVSRIESGWESLLDPSLDAIILDYQLGGNIDGLDILRTIHTLTPDIPVIFITGFGDSGLAREALESGAVAYIPKPLNPADLLNCLNNLVGGIAPGKASQLSDSFSVNLSDANLVTGRGEAGNLLQGRLLGFNQRKVSAHFLTEIGGGRLSEFQIQLGGRQIFAGEAQILSSVANSNGTAVEFFLPGEWKSWESGSSSGQEESKGFRSPVSKAVAHTATLPLEAKAAIDELDAFLCSVHDELEPRQAYFLKPDSRLRIPVEEEFVKRSKAVLFPQLSEKVQAFEDAAAGAIKLGLSREFEAYSLRKLYPSLLCSPFIARVIEKPIGVPGDFGMLGKILGNPFEGASLFSRFINAWILNTGAAKAYRHRVGYLEQKIEDLSVNEGDLSRQILSVGSGVAYEIQNHLKRHAGESSLSFTLVDFSSETLDEARSCFEELGKGDSAFPDFCYLESSVTRLLSAENSPLAAQGRTYRLAYCTGLFDYLSDRVCGRLIKLLFDRLEVGGELVVSNFTPSNPIRHFMGLVLDWKLLHRSAEELRSIAGEAVATKESQIEMMQDPEGVECFAIIRKCG